MVQGQVFLKGRGRLALVLFDFFQGLPFLHLEITLSLAKLYYAYEKKNFFFCHHYFRKKFILICLKMNVKISHKSK